MGVVYRAEHVVLGSPAAVKVLLPQFTRSSTNPRAILHRGEGDERRSGISGDRRSVRLRPAAERPGYIAMELLRGEDVRACSVGRAC